MTTTTATTATTRTTSRAAGVGLWTLQVLLAAVYAFSAYGKLTAEAQNVAGFEAMGLGAPGMYIIGLLELAGAIAMFVPALTGLAATCFVALMIGAVTLTWMIGGGRSSRSRRPSGSWPRWSRGVGGTARAGSSPA